jgi:hypothetical protein
MSQQKPPMKRTQVFKYEIFGSVVAWPVEVDLSLNNRSGMWRLYFRYVDPEARHSETVQARTPAEFLSVLEEHYVNIEEFIKAIKKSSNRGLIELAKQLQQSAHAKCAGHERKA